MPNTAAQGTKTIQTLGLKGHTVNANKVSAGIAAEGLVSIEVGLLHIELRF